MSSEIHSIWLVPAPADEAFLRDAIVELAARFGTPPFAPHLTIRGDTGAPVAALEAAITAAAAVVAAFSEAVAALETGEAYFRSFYARFPIGAPLAALKQRLDPTAAETFMPHVSLLYGAVAPGPKAAAADEFRRRLAGRRITFDRLCVVRSGQDIPIAEWAVTRTAPLANSRA